ncbi:MAG: 2-phospho-L-lactate transferase [Candidatus Tectomicrobia bacterium]|nr:2-phospho-L-lactate transferase [Candidatus Tectomicrobia bacterium]
MKITTLAGGTGASKFILGLINVVDQRDLTIIGNTGDDIEFFGLHISPDLDIVSYTIAGVVDSEKGWGRQEETFHCLQTLSTFGYETWFNLGDKDLATHLHRTALIRQGKRLSEATASITKALGISATILPMTNERVKTIISTDAGDLHIQEYLVKRRAQDRVTGVTLEGIEKAEPSPGMIDAILQAEGVLICPSNPIISIGPIAAVPGVREALKETKAKVIGVSPIVGGAPISGPAHSLMSGLGIEVSAYGVATLYQDFLDLLIIDEQDRALRDRVESLGMKAVVTNTIMKGLEEKIELARTAVNLLR